MMKKIAFFDAKEYDIKSFDRYNTKYEIDYINEKLSAETAHLANGYDGVIAFVNDVIDQATINILHKSGVKVIAMRCAGYNNIDVKAAYEKVHIVRVPAYSPYAVAEHAMALLLALNRKIHKAYRRTRDFNFSIDGLTGFDMYGKTIGIIGTGRIGRIFIDICKGFKMNVIAYDLYPTKNSDINYVSLEELLAKSDIISLHCPLTEDTKYLINEKTIALMKDGVYLINTSRGGLIDTNALLTALKSGKIQGAGLDVYEEEANIFFEDFSDTIIDDDMITLLIAQPNVILTSHQAFLTEEALANIAQVTLNNLDQYFNNEPLDNEICYLCKDGPMAYECRRSDKRKRCF